MRTKPFNLIDLDHLGIGVGADHQVSERFQWEDAGCELVRTVNGDLVALTDYNFRKRTLSVSGSGTLPPALHGQGPGTQQVVRPLTPDCVFKPAGQYSAYRDAYYTIFGDPWAVDAITGDPVAVSFVDNSRFEVEEDGYDRAVKIFFRVEWFAMVESMSVDDDANAGDCSWSIDFREI